MTETILPVTPKDELRALVESSPMGAVQLPHHLENKIWYVKYESMNPLRSDTVSGPEWGIEQVTSHHRTGLHEDDGCIQSFQGYRRGEVAITENGDVLSAEEAEAREDTSGRSLPRYSAYDFKLVELVKTNGPSLREALHRSAEDKRKEGESELLDVLSKTFKGMSLPENGQTPSTGDDIREYLSGLHPTQRKALIEMAEDEIEEIAEKEDAAVVAA